jgi:hypothetical protein
MVSDAEAKEHYRVGTAWAIDDRRLATSAAVVMVVKKLQADRFPQAKVVCKSGAEYVLTDSTVHPEYQKADEAFQTARDNYEQMRGQIAASRPTDQDLARLKEQLAGLSQVAFDQLDRRICFDIGILSVDRALPDLLQVAGNNTSLRPKLKIQLVGMAYDREDPYYDSTMSLSVSRQEGRIFQVVDLGPEDASASRLLIDCHMEQLDFNFAGSPILNADGHVLGLFSRLTPSTDMKLPPSGNQVDAALARHLRDLIPTLP